MSDDLPKSAYLLKCMMENMSDLIYFKDHESKFIMASQLQKTFFPTSYPFFPAADGSADGLVQFCHLHHASRIIGGDLCSIRKLSETEAGIFLCDVMGHGVRAALGTSIVRAVVEEISHQKKDPAAFLQHMNQVLMPLFRQEDVFLYATACYMVLDVAAGIVRYANAGHPLPIHLDADRKCTKEFIGPHLAAGPGLAIDGRAVSQTAEFKIRPGDSVFIYTDGINEVVNTDHEEYGHTRLAVAAQQRIDLPLPKLFSALYDDACRFRYIDTLEDDVCLVGFRLIRQ